MHFAEIGDHVTCRRCVFTELTAKSFHEKNSEHGNRYGYPQEKEGLDQAIEEIGHPSRTTLLELERKSLADRTLPHIMRLA